MKNKMRNEMLLQNFNASTGIAMLCGKNPQGTTESMRSKEYWINLFETAIEDLKAGNYISGKGEKNTIEYWERQIERIKEFEQ